MSETGDHNEIMHLVDRQSREANETPEQKAQRERDFNFNERARFISEARELRKTGREQRALIRELRAEIERLTSPGCAAKLMNDHIKRRFSKPGVGRGES